jgi:hypothetical protein
MVTGKSEEGASQMTVTQLAHMPPPISGVGMSPSAKTAGAQQASSNGYGTTPSTDISFSKEAMQLYAQFVGPPDGDGDGS